MGAEDHAIVVGITAYPALFPDALNGPENDARAFAEWLRSPAGGAVPAGHVTLIRTSQFRRPFRGEPKPTGERVQSAIENLHRIAETNAQAGRAAVVGRRLYLYFAGHGFAPREDQTALLGANANPGSGKIGSGFHILGQYNADWLAWSGYFSEIVLVMDCCRETYNTPGLNMPYGSLLDLPRAKSARRFHAFATQWAGLSREHQMGDGVVRGIFTTALLAGLNGAAASLDGKVTTYTLREYLLNEMTSFLTPAERDDPDVPKEPDVPLYGREWTLVEVLPTEVWVTVAVPPPVIGSMVQIRDAGLAVVQTGIAAAAGLRLGPLRTGTYVAEAVGANVQPQSFRVFNADDVHVQL